MARQTGSNNFAGTLEILASSALDARSLVQTKADLLASGSFPYPYIGMTVSVVSENKLYMLIGADTTVEANWQEVGGSSSQDISKSDFDALTQSEKDNGTTYYIPDVTVTSGMMVVGNRFDKANIYTAEERMIGSWMGKPLYQKTIESDLVSSLTQSIPHGISDIETASVVKFFIVYQGASYNFMISTYFSEIGIDTTNINITKTQASAYANRHIFITLQYTKTSDGQIKIGTLNDYSTDEVIIGTWIDGKKIYQRTISCGALPNRTQKQIPHGIEDIDIIVKVMGIAVTPGSYYRDITITSDADVANQLSVYATPTLIIMSSRNTDLSGYLQSFITLQYTKTTD